MIWDRAESIPLLMDSKHADDGLEPDGKEGGGGEGVGGESKSCLGLSDASRRTAWVFFLSFVPLEEQSGFNSFYRGFFFSSFFLTTARPVNSCQSPLRAIKIWD